MSDWLRHGMWIWLIPLSAWVVPPVIHRLPEPPAPQLPEPGAANETALDRVLRAEGPKRPYAELARSPGSPLWIMGATALLGALAEGAFPDSAAIAAAWLAPVFVLLWLVDWRTRLLPRIVVRPLTAVIVVLALIDWLIRRNTDDLIREFSGGVIAWLIFGLLWFIRRAGMGLGDVRLALPLGMLMAAVSWNAWLIGLYAGFVGFAVFGVGLMLVKRDRRILKRAYPFGPFMIAGAYAGMALAPHWHVIA